jgi:hypothetical protein
VVQRRVGCFRNEMQGNNSSKPSAERVRPIFYAFDLFLIDYTVTLRYKPFGRMLAHALRTGEGQSPQLTMLKAEFLPTSVESAHGHTSLLENVQMNLKIRMEYAGFRQPMALHPGNEMPHRKWHIF